MDLETALNSLDHQLAEARPVPLSASVMVNREDLERIVQAIRAAMPEEIRQARWVLKERDELLAQASRDAEQVVADGQLERDRILSETEIVREAHREAQRIIDRASEEGRKIRHEAEDFVDAKLGDFEVVLQKTLATVTRGRDRLRGRQASAELRDLGEDATLPGGMPVVGQPLPAQAGGGQGESEGDPDVVRSRGSRFVDLADEL
jgi:cell division septum initiation protein DivIVA